MEYSLTEKGRNFVPVLTVLEEWTKYHELSEEVQPNTKTPIVETPSEFVEISELESVFQSRGVRS